MGIGALRHLSARLFAILSRSFNDFPEFLVIPERLKVLVHFCPLLNGAVEPYRGFECRQGLCLFAGQRIVRGWLYCISELFGAISSAQARSSCVLRVLPRALCAHILVLQMKGFLGSSCAALSTSTGTH
jgi:hypothetical protein